MKAIFVETRIFEKLRSDYLSNDSYHEFQSTLMETPKSGAVIQGTGGIRKIR